MAPLEPDQRLLFLLPDPLGLPEVRRGKAQSTAVSKFQRPTADPPRVKDGDIGIGPDRSNGHPRVPEALAFEGPVIGLGFGIGEASALKAQGGDDIVAGTQFVLALTGGGLDPEKLLSGSLGNESHAASLSNPERAATTADHLGNIA